MKKSKPSNKINNQRKTKKSNPITKKIKKEKTKLPDLVTREQDHILEQLKLDFFRAKQTERQLLKKIQTAEKNLELINNKVEKVKSTLSYQLGYSLIHGFKSFSTFMQLPKNLFYIYQEAKKRRQNKKAKNDRLLSKIPVKTRNIFSLPINFPVPNCIDTKTLTNFKKLKIAAIMDNFTFGSYEPECQLLALTPLDWEKELESFQPELLFIESAWRGKDDLWGNRVGHTSQELMSIVTWCNEKKIPTIFWNKEDPVHFETFLNTAKLFDFIFTTDIDCIQRYKDALNHERVYLLPFACQPLVNNPIEKYKRKDAICFAGAYYARYPDRTNDLANFLSYLPNYKPVEIYDRNHGKTDPDYQFPNEYQPFIVGTLAFDEIDKAYKGYNYAINLNSIKQSQSMFARRVFELLASNTLTLSNFSRGIKLLLGDLVICSDSGEELLRRIKDITQTNSELRKFKLAGLRKVMHFHTYQDRLAYIVKKIWPQQKTPTLPAITIIGYAKNQEELDLIIKYFTSQSYQYKRLLVITQTNLMSPNKLTEKNIYLELEENINDKLIADLEDDSLWIGGMNPNDYYGPNYLLDMILASRYSEALIIGKDSIYSFESNTNTLKLTNDGTQYRYVSSIPACSAILRKELISKETVLGWIKNLPENSIDSQQSLSIDEFNYCKNGSDKNFSHHTTVNDCIYLDAGIDLERLLEELDKKQSLLTRINQSSFAIRQPHLAKHFKTSADGMVKVYTQNDSLKIESHLADGQHQYLYSPEFLKLNDLGFSSHLKFFLETTPGLNIQVVFLFFNANKERIGHIIKSANINNEVPIPPNAEMIRLGLRVYSHGIAAVKEMLLGEHKNIDNNENTSILEKEHLAKHFKTSVDNIVKVYTQNDSLKIESHLEDGQHQYLYSPEFLKLSDLGFSSHLKFFLETTPGLNIQVVFLFFNANKERIGHIIKPANKNNEVPIPPDAEMIRLGLRVYAHGTAEVKKLIFGEYHIPQELVLGKTNYLLLTNHYPSYDNLYRNGFVHRRVIAYKEHGINVDVFRFSDNEKVSFNEFENVDIISGNTHILNKILSCNNYKSILIHFLDEKMWEVLKNYISQTKLFVWIHGSEIQSWHRRAFNYQTELELQAAKRVSEKRSKFWKELLTNQHPNLKLIFVSQHFANEVEEDLELKLKLESYTVIHNFIDTSLFKYQKKPTVQRKKILSIRPYTSHNYANDLSVKAILELAKEPYFSDLEFRLIGEGKLFDEALKPLRKFKNVYIEKRFLTQKEIATIHKEYGIILSPTRADTQGVSRDEAMASGLVPITNCVAAIPEFVDNNCGLLAKEEDFHGLAEGIAYLYNNPHKFSQLSAAANKRVHAQSSAEHTIRKELNLFVIDVGNKHE